MERFAQTFDRILKDSRHLLQVIEDNPVYPIEAIITFDISDYYPNADHDQLIGAAVNAYRHIESNNLQEVTAFRETDKDGFETTVCYPSR